MAGYLAELKLFITLIIYIHQGIKLEMQVHLKKKKDFFGNISIQK